MLVGVGVGRCVERRIYRESLVTEMGIVFALLLTILKEWRRFAVADA